MPRLGIPTKLGAPFICIEPWQGFSDPAGLDTELFDRPGVIDLAAGQANIRNVGDTPAHKALAP